MKIKTKLTLGVGLLFIMIIGLSLVAAFYINALKHDTKNILADNYSTLEYARNMVLALDELRLDTAGFNKFEINLKNQLKNITEPGEQEATEQLAKHFRKLKATPHDSALHILIRQDIAEIMKYNMLAIQRKSNVAVGTAEIATLWIVITGSLCFIIAFILLVNLPNNIAGPIKELTESIKQIAAKNYSQRVDFEGHNEFGELANSFNIMAEKLEEYNSSSLYKLLFEKKRIETLINNMHDPVIGLDENKRILFVNNEAIKIIGMAPEHLLGKFAQDVSVTNDLMRTLIQDIVLLPSTHLMPAYKQPIKIYADNKESYFEKEIIDITIVPAGEQDKRHIGHVIILNNITPFKELDFAKTNFIATVSHELKTPLSSIKMSLQLLALQQTGNLNEAQTQLIESIKEDSTRLLKITGELLNMAQVEAGNIQLNIQHSNPYDILNVGVEAVKVQAHQKQIQLNTKADENLPYVKADTEKTAWVLINFLTNAIHYSPEHSVIEISIRKEGSTVTFAVRDEGRGIENRYRDKIFDKYFQVPGSNKTGTGLGLAISKEFIEAQGGKIGVESEIGMGSKFYFKLHISSDRLPTV